MDKGFGLVHLVASVLYNMVVIELGGNGLATRQLASMESRVSKNGIDTILGHRL